jgi:hypothetical protein
MSGRSIRTRLWALEKQQPTNDRSYHIRSGIARGLLRLQPELNLVESRDTDAATYRRIRTTIALANHDYAEVERLEAADAARPASSRPWRPRGAETPLQAFGRWFNHLGRVELPRRQAAQDAAIAAARARIARTKGAERARQVA